MHIKTPPLAFLAAILLSSPANAAPSDAVLHNAPHITVLSAAGMEDPLVRIIREYSRAGNVSATLAFPAAASQAEQIAAGDSADVIITSHPIWTYRLKQMGLLDVYSISNLAKDSLAVIGRKGDKTLPDLESRPFPEALARLARQRKLYVVEDTDASALGTYSHQALRNAKRPSPLGKPAQGANALLSDADGEEGQEERIVSVPAPRDVLRSVVEQNAVGMTYYSMAAGRRDVSVIYVVPESYHDPVIYQMAVVAGENMPYARKLQAYLSSPEILEMFYRKGYKPLK